MSAPRHVAKAAWATVGITDLGVGMVNWKVGVLITAPALVIFMLLLLSAWLAALFGSDEISRRGFALLPFVLPQERTPSPVTSSDRGPDPVPRDGPYTGVPREKAPGSTPRPRGNRPGRAAPPRSPKVPGPRPPTGDQEIESSP